MELPSVAQSEIVHAFLEGTTCRDLVRELGRSPPVDSSELFDIATSFASRRGGGAGYLQREEGQARGRRARVGQHVQGAPAEAQVGQERQEVAP
jgi:hypothetical protein